MNQDKIGKFIQELRKEKKMTQQELADKLSVTDRAVSHWENGRRLPDISLFKPICEIFNISVNELISGERIDEREIKVRYDNSIIESLNINKKNKIKFKNIIKLLLLLLSFVLILVFIYYKSLFPKFDIYNIAVSQSDGELGLKKKFKYMDGDGQFDVWYYGINEVELCDGDGDCYQIEISIKHNQINMEKVKDFLSSQSELNNIKRFNLWDGGTTIYSNSRYTIIFCNTIDGNKDVYIGENNMFNKLNGAYCGHMESTTKQFTRTYYVVSAIDDNDEDYINVTLKAFQGETAIVKLDRDSNINVGKNYEFTFINYYEFEDTIENIFEYSTVVGIKETSKVGMEQVNESIYVNNND